MFFEEVQGCLSRDLGTAFGPRGTSGARGIPGFNLWEAVEIHREVGARAGLYNTCSGRHALRGAHPSGGFKQT